MNCCCKFFVAPLLIGATLLSAPMAQTRAQSAPQPAVVISIADVSQQLKDAEYLVQAAGFPEMKFLAQTMVKQYTKGVSQKTPAGIMLYFEEGSDTPNFLGFVPVSNLGDLLDTISTMAEVDEGDEITKIVTDDGTEMLVKQSGEIAFISNQKKMLEDLPSNPMQLLGDMPSKYNLAAQLFGQRIPQQMRDKALDGIREGYERQLEMLDQAEPMQAEMQRKNFEFSMKQFEKWLNETESFTLGLCADKDAQSLYMDIGIKALSGSSLAKRFAGSKSDEESLFKGFLIDGAALTQNAHAKVTPDEAEEYEKMLGQMQESIIAAIKDESDLSESDAQVAEKAVKDMLEIVLDTMKAGVIDSGGVVMLDKGAINLAAGIQIADPKKLENTFKELIAIAKEKLADEIQVELNSGSHKDVTFHRLIIDIPDDQEEARDIVGDQVTVILGIGQKAAYIGAGSDPLELLKKAMDGTGGSSEETQMMQYNLYLAPIMKFAASIEGNPTLEKMAAELTTNGRDRINMTSKWVEEGMAIRVEIQDGVLALIKVGMENLGAGGFQGSENDF